MRVIIAGSRDITDYDVVSQAIADSGFDVTRVVSGCCRGVDRLGEQWAKERYITIHAFPANWRANGKAAGPIRNREMAQNADALVAVTWEGGTAGTKNMIEEARKAGLKIHVHYIKRVT